MKEEIKEILAYFEEYIKITDMHDSEPMLNWKDLKIVLDYITNLQEENERLKELCDKYEEEHANEFQCWKRDRKELLELRSRIDKAIEYIKEKARNNCWIDQYEANDLINILQGEDTKESEVN